MEKQNLYLLKVKHTYDDDFEEIGIFSSKEEMEKGKIKFCEMRMISLDSNRYSFKWTVLTLNELY